MKPPLFHVGQAVVCVQDHCFHTLIPENPGCKMPERGPIYHVSEVVLICGLYGIGLCEVPLKRGWFSQMRFAPVEEMPTEAYAELLEALEPVTT